MPGLFKLKPSMLSLDVDGRVVRLETFSKAFAPNMRLSFVTAHAATIDRLILANEISFQQPAGLSQAVVLEVRQGGRSGRGQCSYGRAHAVLSRPTKLGPALDARVVGAGGPAPAPAARPGRVPPAPGAVAGRHGAAPGRPRHVDRAGRRHVLLAQHYERARHHRARRRPDGPQAVRAHAARRTKASQT